MSTKQRRVPTSSRRMKKDEKERVITHMMGEWGQGYSYDASIERDGEVQNFDSMKKLRSRVQEGDFVTVEVYRRKGNGRREHADTVHFEMTRYSVQEKGLDAEKAILLGMALGISRMERFGVTYETREPIAKPDAILVVPDMIRTSGISRSEDANYELNVWVDGRGPVAISKSGDAPWKIDGSAQRLESAAQAVLAAASLFDRLPRE